MTKPKILLCTDDARINTGFGRVARELITLLLKTEKYDIVQHGWYSRDLQHQLPITIYPTAKTRPDPKRGIPGGILVEQDRYGEKTFDQVVLREKPNVVLTIGNVDMCAASLNSNLRSTYRLIAYFPIDSFPIKPTWDKEFEKADRVVLFCPWAEQLIRNSLPNIHITDIIPHGVDSKLYRPFSPKKRSELKAALFPEEPDCFVIGFAGRNIERKRLDLIIYTAAVLRNGWYGFDKQARLIVYSLDTMGNPIRPAGITPGIPQKVKLILHAALQDTMGFPLGEMIYHTKMGEHVWCDPSHKIAQGVDDNTLTQVYNAMDCHLAYGVEGWGLPATESMACGVPNVLINAAAYSDWAKDAALFVPVSSWGSSIKAGDLRPIPDIAVACEYILSLMNPDTHRVWSGKALKRARELSWTKVASQFEKVIDEEIVASPKTNLMQVTV